MMTHSILSTPDMASPRFALISHYSGMHREVYAKAKDHEIALLYLTTSLSALKDISPVIITLKPQDKLLTELSSSHMLLFYAPESIAFSDALAQLRARLYMTFPDGMKALFHYYQPDIALHFFGNASVKDTDNWLGCFDGIAYPSPNGKQQPIAGTAGTLDETFWLCTESQHEALSRYNQIQEALV